MAEMKEENHRRISEGSFKRKYRILAYKRRKTGSCPVILSQSDDMKDEDYLKLADKNYFTKNHELAAMYYSVIFGKQTQDRLSDCIANNKDNTSGTKKSCGGSDVDLDIPDSNNNFTENDCNVVNTNSKRELYEKECVEFCAETSEWAKDYFKAKLMESEYTLSVSPTSPNGYLEKAAVLCFQDQWHEARNVLLLGVEMCSDKTSLKSVILDMDNIEKMSKQKVK